MIKGGLVSITFRQLQAEEIVRLVAEAGLAGIEWGGDVHVPHGDVARAATVRKMTEDAGLLVAAYGSYYRAGAGEEDGPAFSSVLETAEALGAPMLRVWAGSVGSARAAPEYRARVVEDLKRVGALAEAKGIGVSCEFHGGTLTDTNRSAGQLVRELRDSSVKLYWQPPNSERPDYCLAGLEDLLESVTHLHTFHWARNEKGDLVRLPLGEGEEHWMQYLQVANRVSCDRYALLEFVADDAPERFKEDAVTLTRWLHMINAGR